MLGAIIRMGGSRFTDEKSRENFRTAKAFLAENGYTFKKLIDDSTIEGIYPSSIAGEYPWNGGGKGPNGRKDGYDTPVPCANATPHRLTFWHSNCGNEFVEREWEKVRGLLRTIYDFEF